MADQNNTSSSLNPTGRGGKKGKAARSVSKNTTLSVEEEERIEWALTETGLDWSSFLRFAALKVTKEIIG